MGVAVIEQGRPVRQRFVQDRLARRIIADRRAPPLMRDYVRHSPLQAILDRSSLFANHIRHIAHRRRVEINIESAGDCAQTGELRAAQSSYQRRIDDADGFHRQRAQARRVNPHRVGGDIHYPVSDGLVFRPEDRANRNITDGSLL